MEFFCIFCLHLFFSYKLFFYIFFVTGDRFCSDSKPCSNRVRIKKSFSCSTLLKAIIIIMVEKCDDFPTFFQYFLRFCFLFSHIFLYIFHSFFAWLVVSSLSLFFLSPAQQFYFLVDAQIAIRLSIHPIKIAIKKYVRERHTENQIDENSVTQNKQETFLTKENKSAVILLVLL